MTTSSHLNRNLDLFFAVGAGLSVACLYYSQPMLSEIATQLGASSQNASFVPALTQLGYALGILLLGPLADRLDRKNIVIAKLSLLIIALLTSAVAPTLSVLWVASFFVGLTATAAQDYVPAAASLAPDPSRGKTVGTVMTGLLLGILLSRVLSGAVSQAFGWRVMYFVSAGLITALLFSTLQLLPQLHPTSNEHYLRLLKSLATLWQTHRGLRTAAITQALLSVAFSAFWSNLALVLRDRFALGPAIAGAFGLAGAAGALAAPLAGRVADRRGPLLMARLGAALTFASFAFMLLPLPQTGIWQISALIACAVGFDFGVQASLVSHQTIVFSLDTKARSRLNSVLFTAIFIGMASGAILGGIVYEHFGFFGIIGLATLSALTATTLRACRNR